MVGFGRADIQGSGAAVDGRSKIKGYFDILHDELPFDEWYNRRFHMSNATTGAYRMSSGATSSSVMCSSMVCGTPEPLW